MVQKSTAVAGLVWLSLVSLVLAHPNHGIEHSHTVGNGFLAGVQHPLTGFDHLLAMLAVGLIAAQFSGLWKWLLPTSFVAAMLLGGSAAMAGLPAGPAEVAIALSLVVLGGMLAIGKKLPLLSVVLPAALFGFYHGHAHGAELPTMASPVLYAIGFSVSTTLLLLAGLSIGLLARQRPAVLASLRVSGAAITVAGIALLVFAF